VSSNTYSARLDPDARLRLLVLVSGVCLGMVGLALILTLKLHAVATAAVATAWLVLTLSELRGLWLGFRSSRALRIASDGSLMRLDQAGTWRDARLLPGTVVLRRLAWIRLETARGARSAELIQGRCADSHDWRRLQVIWRHIGAVE